ncbi:MAG: hypothetical protein P1V35_04835 [Planctomycetota bacterium]|nr:hypothetical protein [Planctomycetota bacterium]
MVRNRSHALGLVLALSLPASSCVSETTSSQDYGDLNARQSMAKGAWKIWEGQKAAGYVVRFEEKGEKPSVLLSVRNTHNQDLGWIDQLGRAWRYRPHEDPEWVSTGSTLQGVRHILELGDRARLEACDLVDLPTTP